MQVRSRIFLTVLGGAGLALLLAVVISARPAAPVSPVLLVIVAIGLAALSALVITVTLSSFVRQRLDEFGRRIREALAEDPEGSQESVQLDEFTPALKILDEAAHEFRTRLAALERSRTHMEAILAGMVEGVLVVNEQGRIDLANEGVRRMLRLQGPVLGRHYLELLRHPDVARQVKEALAGGSPNGVELSWGRDPGQTFVARAAPIVSGPRRSAVLVLHDITDLRLADQIRRDFVANVSHELRTPLTAIRGYVEALLDSPPENPETRRFLEIIARHSSRMERLVQDLLRLARLDAGQETLEIARLQAEALFGGVIAELSGTLGTRRLGCDLRIDPPGLALCGDPSKLHDVLRNLVENAVSYAPEGSTIDLRAEAESNEVVFTVADHGPGIPDADLTRVFERFYRVDKARSRESGGTGLGLSIVKHLVGLHGGEVRARNRPEGGAVFTVRLPAGDRPGAQTSEPRLAIASGRREAPAREYEP
jgi:two-component system, OmpR family, phosphate regulon sensor histidine kinase PhoR